MCGIGGIAGRGHAPEIELRLNRMVAAMRHRGPDQQGIRVEHSRQGLVGLCAARLAVRDLTPRGHQPMISRRSGTVMSFNGELYNTGELRQELVARGHGFVGASDTEVALVAFDEWGLDCLHRLRGMFGLAVWDPQRGRLLLARDRLGIKPLYWAQRGKLLVFASEVRAILASGLIERSPSLDGLTSFLTLGGMTEPSTVIEGISELPAGHYGVWSDDGLQVSEYWSLASAFTKSEEVSVATLGEALREAVALHLAADVPIGVFLSGGVDSSSIAALAALTGGPVRTVSVVFPGQPRISEDRFIAVARERLATAHTEVPLEDRSFLRALPGAIAAMDQPTADGVNTYVVSQAARNAGLTVALSGTGGDELFAGYPSFRRVPALRRLRDDARRLRAMQALRVVQGRSDRLDRLREWAQEPDRTSAYELERELFDPALRLEVMPESAASSSRPLAPPGLDPVNEVSFLELTHYMRNVLLRDIDAMSMAHSLEVRVPFLDHKLVELVAKIPGALKVESSLPKPVLVNAVGDLLPSEITRRSKMFFSFPFDEWMRTGLRRELEGKLTDPAFGGPVAEVLDPAGVTEVWRRFLCGRAGWATAWALYVLKSWAECHLVTRRSPVTA